MEMKKSGRFFGVFIAAGSICVWSLLLGSFASAQYSGTQYKIEEAQVGAVGSDNDLQSTNYQGRATAGDTAVGIVNGTTYQAIGGFTTSEAPELEVVAGNMTLDLGDATTGAALTGTSQFGVRSYLAEGYVVIIRGVPPTQEGGYTMAAMPTQAGSSPGTEQFGINLVANTAPATFGTAPQQIPDNTFSFGYAHTNYDDTNQYRYVDGDIIAQSNTSSGVTNYTVSYLVNISSITPAGTYVYRSSVNVVATY